MMQGRIWVESALGKGSVFHVIARFRVQAGLQRAAASDEVARRVPTASRSTGEKLAILLVEDNAANRVLVQRVLEKHGHDVVAVEARAARRRPPPPSLRQLP